MRKSSIKKFVGKEVRIDFFDHCKSAQSLAKCRIWGKVKSLGKHELVVVYWELLEEVDPEVVENNREFITISFKDIINIEEI